MNALYYEDLVVGMSCGCGNPQCNKKAEWLHARCHIKSGLMVTFTENILFINCNTCKTSVVNLYYDSITNYKRINISHKNETTFLFSEFGECSTPECSINMGLEVRFDNYQILLYCHKCKELVATVTIRKRESTGG